MNFSLAQKELLLAIKALNKILPKNPHLPILSGILLIGQEKSLELYSTDLNNGLKVVISAQIKKPGRAVINGKALIDAVSFFEQTETTFALLEKEVLITNGHDKIKIPLLIEEFPDFKLPDIKGESQSLEFWERVVKKVSFATGSDQNRPALTGVLFDSEAEETKFVGTDGYRLAVLKTDKKIFTNLKSNIILSAKTLTDVTSLAQIFVLKKISFAYDKADEKAIFSADNFTYFSKSINASYPPYEKIIPLDFTTQITLDREELIKNLTKALVFAYANNKTVDLTINKQKITFFASTLNAGSFNGEQNLESQEGEELQISFNIKYLLDFLQICQGEVIWLGFNNATAPAMIKDLTDENLIYIAMPFKAKN